MKKITGSRLRGFHESELVTAVKGKICTRLFVFKFQQLIETVMLDRSKTAVVVFEGTRTVSDVENISPPADESRVNIHVSRQLAYEILQIVFVADNQPVVFGK